MTKPRVGKLHHPSLGNHRKTRLLIGALQVFEMPTKVPQLSGQWSPSPQRCYQSKSLSEKSRMGPRRWRVTSSLHGQSVQHHVHTRLRPIPSYGLKLCAYVRVTFLPPSKLMSSSPLAVLTDWLSTLPALGWALRPACKRTFLWDFIVLKRNYEPNFASP